MESNYRDGPADHKKYPYDCFVVLSSVITADLNTPAYYILFKFVVGRSFSIPQNLYFPITIKI